MIEKLIKAGFIFPADEKTLHLFLKHYMEMPLKERTKATLRMTLPKSMVVKDEEDDDDSEEVR